MPSNAYQLHATNLQLQYGAVVMREQRICRLLETWHRRMPRITVDKLRQTSLQCCLQEVGSNELHGIVAALSGCLQTSLCCDR